MSIKTVLYLSLALLAGCTSAFAQNANDFLRLFGGIMQGAVTQATLAEWRKLSQNELSCVDQAFRQRGSNLQTAIQQGITPSDPRIADIRGACRSTTVQDTSSDTSIYFVANTQPPDAFLSLRTNPTSASGQRITTMPNGTRLQVLQRQNDGWWYVKVVPSGPEGWALSGQGNRTFIECCTNTAATSDQSQPQSPTSASTPTPSFNCDNVNYRDELAICSSEELSQLDNAVAAGNEYVRRNYGDQYAKSINVPLFQARRACGSDEVCIKQQQILTIRKFESLGAPVNNLSTITSTVPTQTEQLLWDHNGSTVYLVAQGHSRKFFYKEPREGMLIAGAKPGSMLFDGEANGEQYQGTAYRFHSRCGTSPYKVSGPILDDYRRVELRGQKPRIGDNCQIIGYDPDLLVFQLIEPTVSTSNGEQPAQDKTIDTVSTKVGADEADKGILNYINTSVEKLRNKTPILIFIAALVVLIFSLLVFLLFKLIRRVAMMVSSALAEKITAKAAAKKETREKSAAEKSAAIEKAAEIRAAAIKADVEKAAADRAVAKKALDENVAAIKATAIKAAAGAAELVAKGLVKVSEVKAAVEKAAAKNSSVKNEPLFENIDVLDQLAKFAELRASGVLTDDEFEELKRNLIGPSPSKPLSNDDYVKQLRAKRDKGELTEDEFHSKVLEALSNQTSA